MACFLDTFCLKQLGLGVHRVEEVRLNIFGPQHDIVPTSLKRVMGVTRMTRVQRWGEVREWWWVAVLRCGKSMGVLGGVRSGGYSVFKVSMRSGSVGQPGVNWVRCRVLGGFGAEMAPGMDLECAAGYLASREARRMPGWAEKCLSRMIFFRRAQRAGFFSMLGSIAYNPAYTYWHRRQRC